MVNHHWHEVLLGIAHISLYLVIVFVRSELKLAVQTPHINLKRAHTNR